MLNISNIFFFFIKGLKYNKKKIFYFTQLNICIFLFVPAFYILPLRMFDH